MFFKFIHAIEYIHFRVKKKTLEYEIDFTDQAYQSKLPMHARSTASKAIKNNLCVTEILADRNVILNQQKVRIHTTILTMYSVQTTNWLRPQAFS
jgi:hypothetical protein